MLAISRTGSSHPPLVVLDEYLDKDFPSVLEVIKSKLVRLCGSIQLQVIVVTHSANVAKVFCDDVIALNGGRVYSRSSGLAFLSRMPSQLTMI
jgi:ABC-type branched-subunit amino acid transport system ATPase component